MISAEEALELGFATNIIEKIVPNSDIDEIPEDVE